MGNILEMRLGHRNLTNCSYDDYYINGNRLSDTVEIGDFISPFGWLGIELEDKFARMLLGLVDSDLRKGRIPIFVCPQCVDYGCGVGTCEIDISDRQVTWKNFGWETDYEEKVIQTPHQRDLRFSFPREAYDRTFRPYLIAETKQH